VLCRALIPPFPIVCLSLPVWRALVQMFPRDPATYTIDAQFMLGDALMGIPIVEQGADSVDGYLPNQVTSIPTHHSFTHSNRS
jgi:alpha-glucosidase (family GH31 glycosyl hydrolase)